MTPNKDKVIYSGMGLEGIKFISHMIDVYKEVSEMGKTCTDLK